MADNSARAAKMVRNLAITQIIIGVLLLGLGIADRLVYFYWYYYNWTGYGYFGVWIGVWMLITGGLGIPGSETERTSSRNAFAGVFMGFSIISTILGGIIIVCYGIGLAQITVHGYVFVLSDYNKIYIGKLAILAIMLVLGIVTFGLGISAAVYTGRLDPCTCCTRQPQFDQPMYPYPAGGYVITQPPGSVSVAASMQAGGNMAAAQGFHQPMVPVPVSGAPGGQHLTVPGASPQGMAKESPQPWEHHFQPGVEKPPSYGNEGYTAQQEDQTKM